MTPQTFLIIGVLVALLVAGSRGWLLGQHLPSWLRPFVDSGVSFIILGVVIGPQGANLITGDHLTQLQPLILVGLGWIGFLYGAHFEWRLMRRYPPGLYAAGSLQALFTFAVVAGAMWWVLPSALGSGWSNLERLSAALILGICAAGTAPAGTFRITSQRGISHHNQNILRFMAAIDDLPALAVLALATAWTHPAILGGSTIFFLQWVALSIGLGLVTALIAHWVFPRGEDIRHNSLILLGIVALGAGVAGYLRISPLFVTAVAGMTFANISHRKESAYGLLAGREHLLYAIVLLLAGILTQIDWKIAAGLVPLLVLSRLGGKIAGGWLGWWFLDREKIRPWIGGGLIYQGGMALAIAVSFDRLHQLTNAHHITTAVVLAVLINEIIAGWIGAVALQERKRS